jgi:tetratricopeptide (TPR) repeat protein
VQRLLLPFYHIDSFVIKAYATEMQPLPWDLSDPFVAMMALGLALVVLGYAVRQGQGSYAFLLLVFLMAHQGMDARRHVALAGFMMPGALLSTAILGTPWPVFAGPGARLVRVVFFTTLLGISLISVQSEFGGPAAKWAALEKGHILMPYAACDWMKRPDIALDGKMIHRTEIGGWLQYSGFNHGQTFCDTGFGKFPTAIVHLSGLLADRPGWLPSAIERYKPDIAIIGVMSFDWPEQLRQLGWRLVYYHPSGSVYVRPEFRPDLPAVPDTEVQRIYSEFMQKNGSPGRGLLSMYYLMTLNSMGLKDFAYQGWRNSPHAPRTDRYYWYFPATCFFRTPMPADRKRQDLLDAMYAYALETDGQLSGEPAASSAPPPPVRAGQFRAHYLASQNRWEEALALAQTLPRLQQDPVLVAQALLALGRDSEAEALLRDRALFEVGDARRYYLLAAILEKQGKFEDALQPARYAAYFMPDDAETRALAQRLIEKTKDASLSAIVADPLGAPLPPKRVP